LKKLTLVDQGKLYYAISPLNKPTLRIDPGETISIETEDAFSGQIRKESDRRDLTKIPYPNPQSGPIFINGAKKGDTLAIKIEDIRPLIGQGATRIISFWYTSRYDTELMQKFLVSPEIPHGTKVCPIENGKVFFDGMALPYRPMIGTIATADSMETYLTWFPGPHGGNMDIPEIIIGATLYLPVRVDGALLHLGDVHAIQGSGELSGGAVEMPSLTTLTIDLLRVHPTNWPRLENEEMLFTVAATQTGRTFEEAMRLAFMELIFWLENEYGIERWHAFELLTMVSNIRVGNFWTVAVGIPKEYLKSKEMPS
jgi:acetamidase/formamidase